MTIQFVEGPTETIVQWTYGGKTEPVPRQYNDYHEAVLDTIHTLLTSYVNTIANDYCIVPKVHGPKNNSL